MTALLFVLVFAQNAPAFDDVVTRIEVHRQELASRYRRAPPRARAAVIGEARAYVVRAIVDEVLPAWMGTPWGLGRNSTAARPHEPGKVVGCSYFVTAVLENAGVELESRTRFAQAPSLWIQRALLPYGGPVHRFGSVEPARLRQRIAALGDGLYLVGLDYHVGFLVVRGADVRIVHASYFPPQAVVSEPVESSAAIAGSRPRGYWVSRLFHDDRLVELWLRGAAVPAPPPWPPRPTPGARAGGPARSPRHPRSGRSRRRRRASSARARRSRWGGSRRRAHVRCRGPGRRRPAAGTGTRR